MEVTRQFVATKTKLINKGDSLKLRTDVDQSPTNGFLGKSLSRSSDELLEYKIVLAGKSCVGKYLKFLCH